MKSNIKSSIIKSATAITPEQSPKTQLPKQTNASKYRRTAPTSEASQLLRRRNPANKNSKRRRRSLRQLTLSRNQLIHTFLSENSEIFQKTTQRVFNHLKPSKTQGGKKPIWQENERSAAIWGKKRQVQKKSSKFLFTLMMHLESIEVDYLLHLTLEKRRLNLIRWFGFFFFKLSFLFFKSRITLISPPPALFPSIPY